MRSRSRARAGADQDQLQLTTTGTLPAGLATGTTLPAHGQRPRPVASGASPAAGPISPWVCQDGRTPPKPAGSINSASPAAAAGDRFQRRHGTHTATRKRTASETFFRHHRWTARPSHSSAGTGTHTFTLRSKCVQVGTQTPFLPAADGGEMFADQNRRCRITRCMRLPMTRYGVECHRLSGAPAASKPSTADEIAPRRSLMTRLFVPVFNQSARGGSGKMTAMLASQKPAGHPLRHGHHHDRPGGHRST